MKNFFRGLLFAGLISLALPNYVKDFITIDNLKYNYTEEKRGKKFILISKESSSFEVKLRSYDNQKIEEIGYFLDKEYIGSTVFLSDNKNPKRLENTIELPYVSKEKLQKGKHVFEARLLDCKGNRTSDNCNFEVD